MEADNATRQYLSRPDLFKQIHLHTDIRLGLGWLSVFVAAGTALYGYKIDFEKSKPVVTIGLVLCASPLLPPFSRLSSYVFNRYMVLTALSTLYAYFIEGETVFVGKRKTFSKRVGFLNIIISQLQVLTSLSFFYFTDNN